MNLGDAARCVTCAGNEAHQRTVARNGAGPDKMQSRYCGFESITQHGRAIRAGDFMPQVGRQEFEPGDIDLVAGGKEDMIIDSRPRIELQNNLSPFHRDTENLTALLYRDASQPGLEPGGGSRAQTGPVPQRRTVLRAAMGAG